MLEGSDVIIPVENVACSWGKIMARARITHTEGGGWTIEEVK